MAATVASVHLAHAQLNCGLMERAGQAGQRALELLGDDEGLLDPREAKLWGEWRAIAGRSRKDLELWCQQLLAVTRRVIGGKRNLDEAAGRLLYVVREAPRGHMNPKLVSGNALRDLATAKLRVDPKAEIIRKELDQSIAALSETDAGEMVSVSLLRRGQWHKAHGSWEPMERDVIAGLALFPEARGVLRWNVLNSVAEIYADLEPALARRLALEAQAGARAEGHVGQYQRAEASLKRLGEESQR